MAGRTGDGSSPRHRGRRPDRYAAGDPQPLGQLLAAGRLTEAATVALDGIQQARRLGLAHFKQILACNATERCSPGPLGPGRAALPRGPGDQPVRSCLRRLAAGPDRPRAGPGRPGCRPGAAAGRAAPAPRIDSPGPRAPVRCLVGWPSWRCGAATPTRPGSWSTRRCPRWRPTPATPRRSTPSAYRGRHCRAGQGPSPPPAGPDDHTATTLLDRLDRAATGRAGAGLPELAAWYATARRTGPPTGPPTRPPGPPRPRPGSNWANPTGPPTPASATPKRCWRRRRPRTATAVLRRAAEVTGRLGARPLDAEVRPGPACPPGPGPTADGAAAAPAAGRPRSWSSWA